MLEGGHDCVAQSAREGGSDQAEGLRRIFEPRAPHWLPILLATGPEAVHANWLARLARAYVGQGDRTLLVDAARVQVATAFGLRLRYDLQHAFDGDCAPAAACVKAGDNLAILPAARSFARAGLSPDAVRRLEQGLRSMAAGMDSALLALAAPQAQILAALAGEQRYSDVLIVVGSGPAATQRCLDTMNAARGAADINVFRLLFQDMDSTSAGRLFPRLAAVAEREWGVRVIDGGRVADAMALVRLVRAARCRCAPDPKRTEYVRHDAAVENGS